MIKVVAKEVMKASKDHRKEIKVQKVIHNRAIALKKIKANKNKKKGQNKKDQGLNLHTIIIPIQEKKEEIKDLAEETKRLNINKIKS